jgi:hypothetical protein
VKWLPVNKVCLQSSCGTYTVTKSMTPTGWRYQAFKGKAFLHIADSADECKQACEVDREARPIDA